MLSKLLAASVALAFLAPPLAARAQPDAAAQKAAKTIEMTVTDDGFVPARVKVKKDQPVRLVITRKTERTCATEIVIKDHGINQPLPLGKAVTVEFTPRKAGQLRYACAMNMIAGVLVVE
jgi:plastocyanin domain-containing protein